MKYLQTRGSWLKLQLLMALYEISENLLLNQPIESHSNCPAVEINDKTVTDFLGTRQRYK